MKRVAITGAGVICALGRNAEEVRTALKAGKGGIAPLQCMDGLQLRFRNGAEIPGYREEEFFSRSQSQLMDPFAQYGLIAAREAVKAAGLEIESPRRGRAAVITGSAMGGQATQDLGFEQLYKRNGSIHPLSIARTMANAAASHIAMEFGVTGPAFTISTACSSATHAIGLAAWMVRSGAADVAITGGSEAPFSPGCLKAWEAMRVVSADTCRPFSRDRSGMILGEGAAMFVLEAEEIARARGARIQAVIAGLGMSSDAHHITHPSVDGPARAMQTALEDAGLAPEQIGHINAHGTGTQVNDPAEAAAIRRVFGEHTDHIAVSGTKSMHGHALGAAGALEMFATMVALQDGVIPPTINFTEADPQCALDVVTNAARRQETEFALSNSFAFGGLNAVLALQKGNG